MASGFVTVKASSILDASGVKLVSGRAVWTPVDNTGQRIGVRAGGTDGGQLVDSSVTFLIAGGAFTTRDDGTACKLADVSMTNPLNIGYKLQIVDSGGTIIADRGYEYVQPMADAQGEWSFDTYTPSALLLPLVQGIPGPQGIPGITSAHQLANLRILSDPRLLVVGGTDINAKNYFNEAFILPDSVVLQDGSTTNISGFCYGDLIPTYPGGQMVCNRHIPQVGAIFYDIDWNPLDLSTGEVAAGTPFNVPNNAAYLRLNLATSDAPGAMLVNGTALPTSYVGYGVATPAQASSLAGAAATQLAQTLLQTAQHGEQPGTNLFNKSFVGANAVVTPPNVVTAINGFSFSDFIPANSGGQMTCNKALPQAGPVFYDFLGQPLNQGLGAIAANTPFSIPAAAGFLRINLANGDIATAMLVNGTAAALPSTYRDYGVLSPSQVQDAINATLAEVGVGSLWRGKTVGIFGTSISAFGVWQAQVTSAKGMTIGFDASIAGSHTGQAFDKLFATSGQPAPSSGGPINMTALTSALNGVDTVWIEYGTNDLTFIQYQGVAMGDQNSPASITASNSMGWVEFLLETLLSVKPDLQIIWITPYRVEWYPGVPVVGNDETHEHYSNANLDLWYGYCALKCSRLSVPVIDQRNNGINMYSMCDRTTGAPDMLRDKLHPSDKGFLQCMSPYISRNLELFARAI